MKTRQEILQILSRHLEEIRGEYGVERIGVFGSVLRDEQTDESDVDVLVEFSQAVGMVRFLQLEHSLQDLLGARVDLVTRKALKKHIGQRIMREIQFVG